MNDQAAVDGGSSTTTTPPSSSSESTPPNQASAPAPAQAPALAPAPAPVYVPLADEGKPCETTLDGSSTEFESYYTKEFKWTSIFRDPMNSM